MNNVKSIIRKGLMIEVGFCRNNRPSYRWVQGWEVKNLQTGNWSTPMRYFDALISAHMELKGATE